MWNLKWLYKKKWKVDRLTYWFLIPWEWPGTVNYIVSKHGKSFMQTHNKEKEINIAISTSLPRLVYLISLEFGICRKFSRKPNKTRKKNDKLRKRRIAQTFKHTKELFQYVLDVFRCLNDRKKEKLSSLQWSNIICLEFIWTHSKFLKNTLTVLRLLQ